MMGALSPETREYPIMGELSGHQQEPCIAFGAKGGFMVWHHDSGKVGSSGRLVIQSLNRGMVGMGLPVPLSQAPEGTREARPSIALLVGGGAVVAWEAGPRDSRDVLVRFVSSSGLFTTATITANTRVQGDQFQPAVVALAAGGVVVAWTSNKQDSSGKGVFAQRFTSAGAKVGAEFRVNDSTKWDQGGPSLSSVSDGRFVVVWVSESINGQSDQGAPNLRGNLMGRLFRENGQPIAREFRVNQFDAVCSSPMVQSLGKGFAVVWEHQEENIVSSQSDIYIRSFDENGRPLVQETRWNALAAGAQKNPVLVASQGDGLLAWECEVEATNSREIHARMLSGGAEFRVNQKVRYHQQQPAVVADESGNFLVVWVNFIKPRNSTLTAVQFSMSDRADVTSGAHVSYEGPGATSLVLAAKTPVSNNIVERELQRRSVEQQLTVEFNADEKSRQAALVAQAAAAAKANGLLQQLAVQAQASTVATGAGIVQLNSHVQSSYTREDVQNNQNKERYIFPNKLVTPVESPANTGTQEGKVLLSSTARASIYGSRAFTPQIDIRRTLSSPMRAKSGVTTLPSNPSSVRKSSVNSVSHYRQVTPTLPRGMQRLGGYTTQHSTRGMISGSGGNNQRTVGQSSPLRQAQGTATARRLNSTGLATLRSQTTGGSRSMATATSRLNATRSQRMPTQTRARQSRASTHVNASMVRNGAGYQLQWSSRSGSRYQVQRSRDSNSWVNDGPVKRGTGRSINSTVSTSGQYRYFRVIKSQ